MEKKRRRELDRLERAATRKGTAKLSPQNNATTFAASSASEDDKEMGLVGDRLLQPKTLYDSSGEADVAVAEARRSERDRDRSDTVEPFDKETRYDVGENDRTCSDDRKSPPELIVGMDATSGTQPPEAKPCPFSIESLLQQPRTNPPGERRPNESSRPSNSRTCRRRPGQLHFQPVGFQVERLSPSTVSAPPSIRNPPTAN